MPVVAGVTAGGRLRVICDPIDELLHLLGHLDQGIAHVTGTVFKVVDELFQVVCHDEQSVLVHLRDGDVDPRFGVLRLVSILAHQTDVPVQPLDVDTSVPVASVMAAVVDVVTYVAAAHEGHFEFLEQPPRFEKLGVDLFVEFMHVHRGT